MSVGNSSMDQFDSRNSVGLSRETKGKEKVKKKRGFSWLSNSIQLTGMVTLRSMSLIDLITDVVLLIKVSQLEVVDNKPRGDIHHFLLIMTVILFVSIICPFFLSYSGTIKVFLFRQKFDNLTGIVKFLALLYIVPTSILYVIFLDFLDILFHIYRWILLVIFGLRKDDITVQQEILVSKFGFDKMSWEGFKRQKSVAQR